MQPEIFTATVTVLDEFGLHARPAASLARTAQEFQSDIRLIFGENSADGKSILDILALAAGRKAELRLECRGSDAPQAGSALLKLFQVGPEPAQFDSNQLESRL